MKQPLELDLWLEFKKELESLESKKQTYVLSDICEGEHREFWDKFLSENFPEGSINASLEKNFAIYLLKNKVDLELIKSKYQSQGWGIAGLLGWVKKVTQGDILQYNTGEIVNWCKEYRPDLLEFVVTKDLNTQKLEAVGIGNKLRFIDLYTLKNFKEVEGGEIIERLIPAGSIGTLGGKRASYKSWLGLTSAICISNGLDFLGFKTIKGAVGYIDRENGYSELKKRVSMIESGLGLSDNKGKIYFLGDYAKLDSTEHLAQIEKFVQEKEIKILFVDVYRRAVSFDENDANEVSRFFVDKIKPFCERTGVSVLFLHHEKKGESPDEMDNLRGSSDLVNYLDFVLTLNRKGNKLTLKQLKSRRSKEIEPIDIQVETDEFSFMKFKSLGVSETLSEVQKCSRKILVFLIETNVREIKFKEFLVKSESFGFSESTSKLSLQDLQARGILEKSGNKFSPYILKLRGVDLEDYLK